MLLFLDCLILHVRHKLRLKEVDYASKFSRSQQLMAVSKPYNRQSGCYSQRRHHQSYNGCGKMLRTEAGLIVMRLAAT